jgi:hypothetical protein
VLAGIAGCCATFGADAAGVAFEVVAALGAQAFVERPGDGGVAEDRTGAAGEDHQQRPAGYTPNDLIRDSSKRVRAAESDYSLIDDDNVLQAKADSKCAASALRIPNDRCGEQYEGQRGGGQDPAAHDGILPQKDCRTSERDRWIPGLKRRKRGTQIGGAKRRSFNRSAYRGPWIEKPYCSGDFVCYSGDVIGGRHWGNRNRRRLALQSSVRC